MAQVPQMGEPGVFWRGQDGKVYVKGHAGVNSAGSWDNNTQKYWSDRMYQEIPDPVNSGGGGGGGGGGGSLAPTGGGGGGVARQPLNQAAVDATNLSINSLGQILAEGMELCSCFLWYHTHMSTATKLLHGVITKLEDVEVKILDVGKGLKGEVHYNPGMCRDDKGNLWISIRSCIHNPKRYKGYPHPVHYQNYLHVGKLDEKTLKVTEVKEVVPEKEYDGFQWGIEDVRLFWREDGLHGIGVILPIIDDGPKAMQAEILIDHKKGTYKLLRNYGRPKGSIEKNWSPPEKPARLFDFTYSPTEIVLDGEVIGVDNPLVIHNGTPLLNYENGFMSIAHLVTSVNRQRTYITVALRQNKSGHVTHISQLFHFDVGWREKLKERIEFTSSAIWSDGKEGEELLVGLGVKDELCGVARVPVEKFIWEEYGDIAWYKWQYDHEPSTVENFFVVK